jgi:chromosome segregation ATPase
MIESIMYFAIGFLFAPLSVLLVVRPVHNRAVRLTTRRLERAIPTSLAEILAEKDLLRAEFAMSTRRLETNIEQLKAKSANQLVEIGKKSNEIIQLKFELDALRNRIRATNEELAAKSNSVKEVERALSDKELKLANLTSALEERSALADSQNAEIVVLGMQLTTLKSRLTQAGKEIKAAEDRRDADRIELGAATQQLMEKRAQFEKFHRRVAELVQQLVAQTRETKMLGRRLEDLENRLVEQSDLLHENEFELEKLRREIEIARKARAELTKNKRPKVEVAVQQIEHAMLGKHVCAAPDDGARQVAYGRLPRRESSEPVMLVTGISFKPVS